MFGSSFGIIIMLRVSLLNDYYSWCIEICASASRLYCITSYSRVCTVHNRASRIIKIEKYICWRNAKAFRSTGYTVSFA